MRMASIFKLSSAAFLSSVIGAASVLAISPIAQAQDQFFKDGFLSEVNWQVEPYIGADAMTRVMRYKNEPTHPFQEHLDTFQPFVGVKLHKYFGIEVGYQQSEKGTKERFFDQNQSPVFFGGGPLLLTGGGTQYTLDLLTTNTVKGWNIGVLGFYPICQNKTDLFLKLGYSNLSHNTELRLNNVQDVLGAVGVSGNDYHHLQDDIGVFSATLGLKQNFSSNFGGRLFINFDRSSRLKQHSESLLLKEIDDATGPNRVGSHIAIEPHNSWALGVGFFYLFK